MTRDGKLENDCAKCGACVPVCPVFQVSGSETDSARGRLHLLQRPGGVKETRRMGEILSHCLLCGACRKVCSRNIDTPQLVRQGRSNFPPGALPSSKEALVVKTVLANPVLAALSAKTALVMRPLLTTLLPRQSGMRLRCAALFPERLFPVTGKAPLRFTQKNVTVQQHHIFGRSARLTYARYAAPVRLPKSAALLNGYRPEEMPGPRPPGERLQKNVTDATLSFFSGCMATFLQPETGYATLRLAQLAGETTITPQGQGCCGLAFDAAGDKKIARQLAERNIAAFEHAPGPILTSCSSCFHQLSSYPALFADDPFRQKKARAFAARVREFSTFFAARLETLSPNLLPAGKTQHVFYHDPCHLKNDHEILTPPRRLLAAIPRVLLAEPPDGARCCGGGGLFNCYHPETSHAVFERLLEQFVASGAESVATSCSGCLIQWRHELLRRGLDIPVVHPAMLFARELRNTVPL